MDICVFCVSPWAVFRQKSFNPVNDLWLWDNYVGAVSGHHLSSTLRAGYKSFSLVEKCMCCSFKLNTGYPVLFLSNRKNSFFSDMLMRMWTQMFECQNLLRQCVSFGPCVCWNMLSCASIICGSSLKKEGMRGWVPEYVPGWWCLRFLETCKSSKFCLFNLGFCWWKIFFHLYPE